ncbi:DUF3418 domain-containing protein [Thermodesulfobacteriota bacterium]
MKRFCKEHFLSFNRMREWRDIHTQITAILKEQKFAQVKLKKKKTETVSKEKIDSRYAAIHRSILSGFLSNIAMKKEKNVFRAARGREVMIFPGSALFNKAGSWIVAGETVQTSRLFARTVANIDCNWLEQMGKDLCKYTYLHPRWERNREEVVATEQVSLFGLIIVPERKVGYGRINAKEACDLFIRGVLINGDVKKPLPFMAHNLKLINQIKDVENRIRRRDLLVSEEEFFEFYKKKLPVIYDMRTLKKVIKEKGTDAFLRMNEKDLIRYFPDNSELSLYPDKLTIDNRKFNYSYKFEPGAPDDGITVKIPATVAATVPPESTNWLVPGLLREKITALIKGLPKEYRKRLVPVANTVAVVMAEMPKENTSLPATLSNFIFNRFDINIPASAWPVKDLPDYLQMRIALTSPGGEELLASRDKAILKQSLSGLTDAGMFETEKKQFEKTGITDWNFGDLPDSIEIEGKDKAIGGYYPGLEKDPNDTGCVSLRLFRHRDKALGTHKEGVTALYGIYFSKDLKFLKKILKLPKEIKPCTDYFGGIKRVEMHLYNSVVNELFYRDIRTKIDFESHARSAASSILDKGQQKLNCVRAVLETFHAARTTLYSLELTHKANQEALSLLNELRQSLSRLMPETFIALYDSDRLRHMVRYIEAISIRAQRGVTDLVKDQKRAAALKFYTNKLDELLTQMSLITSKEKRMAIADFFWLIEEYRVSIFAQELKTPFPVSKKRLDAKLKEIERLV